ncbi:hypothetical protein ACFL3A_04770 [Pseudomonadota bacterium]
MPKLNLDGSMADHLWVRAIMLFPNDLDAAKRCFALEQIKAVIDEDSDDEIREVNVRTLRLLVEAPSWPILKELTTENTKRGIVAGDIFGALYVMDKFNIREPSMNKAVFVAMEFAKKQKYGDGTKMAISEPKIRKCWNEFRSVSHLWAAFRLGQAYPFAADSFSMEGNQAFLEVAQGLFQFGTSYIPLRARPKKTILDRENCWALPNTIAARHIQSERQPDALLKILKKYKVQ